MTAALRIPSVSSWLLATGEVVESAFQPDGAIPSPITRGDLVALHEYACLPTTGAALKYETYAALHGVSRRVGFAPVGPHERAQAVRHCASQFEILRLMGAL